MFRILSNLPLPPLEGYAVRTFGDYGPSGPIATWNPGKERRNLADILPHIPAAEKPDALVISSPEYLPVPRDVAAFPGIRILLITDWNMCLRFLPDLCALFDFCFVDLPGFDLLRRAGAGNVHHQPMFGHDPAVFEYRAMDRNLDVSFCGNLNSGMHRERNRLLARLGKWGLGRPVHLGQAFGNAYLDVLNRSRLVFNYSIRGEANMRLFEAMACGAVPLVESSNAEAPLLFEADRHFIRYEPDRLEETLERLLADPDRIRAIAAEARLAVADHTKARQIRSLLEFAGGEGRSRSGGGSPSASATPLRSAKALVKTRVLGSGYTMPEALAELQALDPALPGLLDETLPAALLSLLEENPGNALVTAGAMLERMLDGGAVREPLRTLFRMKLHALRGRWPETLECADRCLASLDALEIPPGSLPEGYAHFLPPIGLGKGLATDFNLAFKEDLEMGSQQGYLGLIRALCRADQARAFMALDRPDAALRCAQAVPADRYVSLDPLAWMAQALSRIGDADRLRAVYRAWFREKPLDTAAWDTIAEGLEKLGDNAALIAFLGEILILARYFLAPDQVERVRAFLESLRAPDTAAPEPFRG
jgi:hypothetical protein